MLSVCEIQSVSPQSALQNASLAGRWAHLHANETDTATREKRRDDRIVALRKRMEEDEKLLMKEYRTRKEEGRIDQWEKKRNGQVWPD